VTVGKCSDFYRTTRVKILLSPSGQFPKCEKACKKIHNRKKDGMIIYTLITVSKKEIYSNHFAGNIIKILNGKFFFFKASFNHFIIPFNIAL
jgi:hypothetical protein